MLGTYPYPGTWTTPCLHFIRGLGIPSLPALSNNNLCSEGLSCQTCGYLSLTVFPPGKVMVMAGLPRCRLRAVWSACSLASHTVFPCREKMDAGHPETNELSLCTAETCRDQSDPRSWSVQLRHNVFSAADGQHTVLYPSNRTVQ